MSNKKKDTLQEKGILDSAPIGIQIIQGNKIKYINQSCLDYVSYTMEDVLGKDYHEFLNVIHPDDRDFINKQIEAKLKGIQKEGTHYQFRWIKKPKETIWFDVHSIPIQYEGKPADLIFIIDFTSRKTKEKELKYYAMAIEGSRDLIAAIDKEYKYIFANGTFLEYHQLERDQVIGNSAKKVLGEEVFQNVIKSRVDKCFEGEALSYEMTRDYPDLGKRNLEVNYYPINDEKGKCFFVLATIRDITSLKRAEKKLEDIEREFQHLIESSPYSIILLDQQANIIDINAKFTEVFGYSKEETVGQNFFSLKAVPVDKLDLLKERFSRYMKGEELEPIEIKAYSKSGETVYTDPRVSIITIGGKKILQISIKDITEKKKANLSLKESENRYKEAFNRSNFFKDLLAHDIANTFNSIALSLHLIKKKLEPHELLKSIQEYVDLIKSQIDKGSRLINNIWKLNEIESTTKDLVITNVVEVLNDVVKKNPFFLQSNVLIDIVNTLEEPFIMAGPFLADAFENLIINGIQHNNSKNKEIEIKIYSEQIDK
ncbi:MAG: PAS domain S-box protein, partial [Candidatus Lokiarchaeota archaeon]|nr:PAS domain S-box protein [Candidatus Lokiarchaeota archaeon]